MTHLLLIDVAACVALIMVAALIMVMRWRRAQGGRARCPAGRGAEQLPRTPVVGWRRARQPWCPDSAVTAPSQIPARTRHRSRNRPRRRNAPPGPHRRGTHNTPRTAGNPGRPDHSTPRKPHRPGTHTTPRSRNRPPRHRTPRRPHRPGSRTTLRGPGTPGSHRGPRRQGTCATAGRPLTRSPPSTGRAQCRTPLASSLTASESAATTMRPTRRCPTT